MSVLRELRVLYHMMLAPIRGQSHAERLESFYRKQAGDYDRFRRRLLHGRRELWEALPRPDRGVWVDMGGGTAANLEYLGPSIRQLERLYVVDMCPALLAVAQQRVVAQGWHNVTVIEADATRFFPGEPGVDVVTFSYALTMMPNWFAAVDHAWRLLRPGGSIGVVDFYVSPKHPEHGRVRHPWSTRTFWPLWFSCDNVFPSPDHLPYVQQRFATRFLAERRGTMPYFPGARVPYYLFVGQKTCGTPACPAV